MNKSKLSVIVLLVVLAGVCWYFGFDPREYLQLEFVKSRLDQLKQYNQTHPVLFPLIYAAIYVAVTAASIPGALILTVLCGAIFGFLLGTVIAAVSATIGATIAFLIARYLFDDLVQKKMGERLAKIRENFRTEGALYLFSMRLVPVFPFFAINLLMGLTSIKTRTYAIASLLGMAPGTMVFINAGTQLAKLDSLKGLLTPPILASFALLAAFPYIAKYALKLIKNRRA